VNFEINRDIDIEALSACVHQHLLSLCCRPNRPAAETTRRFHTVGVAAPCLYRDHCIEFHSLSVCSRVYGAVQHSFTHSVEDQRQIADNPLIIGLICRHSITSPLHVLSTDKCDIHVAGAALCCAVYGEVDCSVHYRLNDTATSRSTCRSLIVLSMAAAQSPHIAYLSPTTAQTDDFTVAPYYAT